MERFKNNSKRIERGEGVFLSNLFNKNETKRILDAEAWLAVLEARAGGLCLVVIAEQMYHEPGELSKEN